jgi:hypothetical protein
MQVPREVVEFMMSFPSTRIGTRGDSIEIVLSVQDIVRSIVEEIKKMMKDAEVSIEGNEIRIRVRLQMLGMG